MATKLRCTRTTSADGGGGQIITEFAFSSVGIDGLQLNENVQGSYNETVTGAAADERFAVNDLIDVTVAPAAPPIIE